MAGGRASRLGGGEKALLELRGRPLIAYVIDALLGAEKVDRIFVAVSPATPRTASFIARAYPDRAATVATPGAGYIEDTASVAAVLGLRRPFLVVAADLPLITADIIDQVIVAYEECDSEALSVRVAADCLPPGLEPDLVLADGGARNVPVGINVVDGRHMDRPQREHVLLLREGRLAANVNYVEDLAACERLLDGAGPHRQV